MNKVFEDTASKDSFIQRLMTLGRHLIKHESTMLVAMMIVVGGVWGFIEVTDEVIEGSTRTIDQQIILALRNPDDLSDPVGPHWTEEMMRDFTAMGGVGVLMFLTLSVAGFLILNHKPQVAWLILVTVGGGTLVSLLLKTGFARPRPDLVPHGSYVATDSFPSGHTMLSAVVYLTLGALLAQMQKRWRLKMYLLSVAVLLTVLIGFSRIYLGVHWPTDVLAGWMAGATWAVLC